MTSVLLLTRDAEDNLPAWAWPGGYPIVYYTPTGDMLCPECATADLNTWSDADWRGPSNPYGGRDDYDGPQYADVLYEGIEWCTQCNEAVRGAYEPDTEDE